MPLRRVVAWLLLTLAFFACAAEKDGPARPDTSPSTTPEHNIFVFSNGWHTSIILARSDPASGRIPEAADFPKARYLEFGWGDAEYYPAEKATLGMTLSAALVPTPSVLHVAGLVSDPVHLYPGAEVISLPLDDAGMQRLVDFIDASFKRDGKDRAAATGPGLYPSSRFYPAVGRFHLLNTCNTWTARALKAAGFDVDPDTTRAESLMRQVRRERTPALR